MAGHFQTLLSNDHRLSLLLSTLPLLTRDGTLPPQQPLRTLPMLKGAARQCPTLSDGPGEFVFSFLNPRTQTLLPNSSVTANRSPTGMFGQIRYL